MGLRECACPQCGSKRLVGDDEFELIIKTCDFMCWDKCGTDMIINPMWLITHVRVIQE